MKNILLIIFLLLPVLCRGDGCEIFFSTIPGEYTCKVSKSGALAYVVKGGNGGAWGYDDKTKECADQGLAKGLGARIKGSLNVKKNEILYISVGSPGENGCKTGSGSGGGGYSSISMNSFTQNPIVVAGGGGGNSFGSRGVGGNGGIKAGKEEGGSGGIYPNGEAGTGGLTIIENGQINIGNHSGGEEGLGLTDSYSGGTGGNTRGLGGDPKQISNSGAGGGGGGFGGFGAEGGYYYHQVGNEEYKMGPGVGAVDASSNISFGAGGQGGSGAGGGGGGYAGGGGGGANVTDPHDLRSGLDGAGGGGGGSSLMPSGSVVENSASEPVVTFLSAPIVYSISPNRGEASGGTIVEITGAGFMSNAKVWVGGMVCDSVVVVSSNIITCVTEQNSEIGVDIAVINPDTQMGLGVGLWQNNK
jgi:hypothetical protein